MKHHGASVESAANSANPSGNGIPNLIAYACNLDPANPATPAVSPGSGTAGLPVAGVDNTSGPRLSLEFLRRTAASGPGITYAVETGPVGGPWTSPAGSETVTPINSLWERVVWVSPETLSEGSARLVRLRVTEP